MKDSNFDKHFSNETLPLMQDLSKHYKELLQKKLQHKLDFVRTIEDQIIS